MTLGYHGNSHDCGHISGLRRVSRPDTLVLLLVGIKLKCNKMHPSKARYCKLLSSFNEHYVCQIILIDIIYYILLFSVFPAQAINNRVVK